MTERADAFVFFGATGDLARKMIFPALYRLVKTGRLDVPVIGVAFSGWDVDRLRHRVRESVAEAGGDHHSALEGLLSLVRYVDGDYNDPATFKALRTELGRRAHPVHYLAIPPKLFATVVRGLGESGCARGGRVVVEKPFGHDLASARELNRILRTVFDEDAIYRIDHFLGEETVLNVLYVRMANSMVETLLDRRHVTRVQITMAEDFGVEDRGSFYDGVGCLLDVVENHVFQIVSLLTMDPPATHAQTPFARPRPACSSRSAHSTRRPGPWPVRGLSRDPGRPTGFGCRDVRGPAALHRLGPVGRRANSDSRRQAAARHRDRGRRGVRRAPAERLSPLARTRRDQSTSAFVSTRTPRWRCRCECWPAARHHRLRSASSWSPAVSHSRRRTSGYSVPRSKAAPPSSSDRTASKRAGGSSGEYSKRMVRRDRTGPARGGLRRRPPSQNRGDGSTRGWTERRRRRGRGRAGRHERDHELDRIVEPRPSAMTLSAALQVTPAQWPVDAVQEERAPGSAEPSTRISAKLWKNGARLKSNTPRALSAMTATRPGT